MMPLVLPGVASLSFGGPRPGAGGAGPVCGIERPRRGARPPACRDMRVGWFTAGRISGAGEDTCGAGVVMMVKGEEFCFVSSCRVWCGED